MYNNPITYVLIPQIKQMIVIIATSNISWEINYQNCMIYHFSNGHNTPIIDSPQPPVNQLLL